MRRLTVIATLLTGCFLPAYAQHGGGHGGSSGHAAGGSHIGSGYSGGFRPSGPSRSFGYAPRSGTGAQGSRPGYGYGPANRGEIASRTPWVYGSRSANYGAVQNRSQFRSPYRRPYRPPYGNPDRGGILYENYPVYAAGYFPGYAFGLGYYGDYDDFSDSGYDNAPYAGPDQYYGFDPQAPGPYPSQDQNPYPMQYSVSGPDQPQGQSQAEMQNQIPPGAPYQPSYGNPAANSRPDRSTTTNRPSTPNPSVGDEPAVTLVFKDGRPNQVIHNYLINANVLTVWDDSSHDIPIDQLDVEATRKINHDHGVEFFLPGTRF